MGINSSLKSAEQLIEVPLLKRGKLLISEKPNRYVIHLEPTIEYFPQSNIHLNTDIVGEWKNILT